MPINELHMIAILKSTTLGSIAIKLVKTNTPKIIVTGHVDFEQQKPRERSEDTPAYRELFGIRGTDCMKYCSRITEDILFWLMTRTSEMKELSRSTLS